MVVEDDAGQSGGPPQAPVVVLGDFNVDPVDGAGLKDGVARLRGQPRLRDTAPASAGAAAADQGGRNATHEGPAARDTTAWSGARGPGNLRVDYVLPDARLEVAGAGVFWPEPGETLAEAVAEGPVHRLVWVDLVLP
jgi:endonuclease/exonuclease/phosphatase family metal-dependent hydrolase